MTIFTNNIECNAPTLETEKESEVSLFQRASKLAGEQAWFIFENESGICVKLVATHEEKFISYK